MFAMPATRQLPIVKLKRIDFRIFVDDARAGAGTA
jgi:hypothetical protein